MAIVDLPPNVECIVYVRTLTEATNYEPRVAVKIKEDGGEFKSTGSEYKLIKKGEIKITLPTKTKKFFVDLTVPGQSSIPVSYAIRSPDVWQDWEAHKDPMFVIVWEDDDTNGADAYKDNDIVAAIVCPKKT
jgi:hypothetical protein